MLPELLCLEHYDDLNKVKQAIADGQNTAVFYAAEASKFHLTAGLDKPFLYIVSDLIEARRAKEALEEFTSSEIYLFPEREDSLRPLKTITSWGREERLRTLAAMVSGKAVGVVATAEAVLQFLPKRALFETHTVLVKKGDRLNRDEFCARLTGGGYERADAISKKGEFCVRGDRLEVWRPSDELPTRLEFFDDEVESIKVFAPDTMMSVREIDSLSVFPATDVLLSASDRKGLVDRLKRDLRMCRQKLQTLTETYIEELESGKNSPSLYFLMPYLRQSMDTLIDYLPTRGVVVFSDLKGLDDKWKLHRNVLKTRAKEFVSAGEAFLEQENALMSPEELYKNAENRVKLGFSTVTSSNRIYSPKQIFTIKSMSPPRYIVNGFDQLVADLKHYAINGATVILAAGSEPQAQNLQSLLSDLEYLLPIGEPIAGQAVISTARMGVSLVYPKEKLVLIGTASLERNRSSRKKTDKEKRAAFVMPEKGSYVVHEIHGIGLSEGVQQIQTAGGLKDFYVVLYKNNDRLYLPVDQMDMLERYSGGGTPSLHRLGGKEFERIKEKVRQATKEMAFSLLELYEKREAARGHRYQADTVWQKELEDSFPFTETDDQLIAIREIKDDMERGKIMDRLLAGDVGFGKTEVAIRIMFKTIIEGKQAAILAPTTILAEQHFRTISERLKPFGLKVDFLSRLAPDKEVPGILNKLKSGETQVIVATHRLLSKDVGFKDLGLLVLDEEQRFGVEHKEKIKLLKNNVNVLTLSATPIPRTLHMALSGIRDISTLETPPVDRLPVDTYVTEYSDALVVDALKKELQRGGQAFVLYNSVERIDKYFAHLQTLLPGVPMVYAHGQMDGVLLEDTIRAFYEKHALVMVSTTIIENGIDIPDANTLIVLNSDRLGLSQMYQLRGRVGRSNVNAYAYFTVPEGKVLSSNAEKRLEALLQHTELGSGFSIAMRDLEIRGAGNVLGKEQHGNMEKVGYDMYCRLIKESVDELRGKKTERKKEIEIITDCDTGVPLDYIKDQDGRVRLFKRVSGLRSRAERLELISELTDAYGFPPDSVLKLLSVGVIKNIGQTLDIKKVEITEARSYASFYTMTCFQNERLMHAAADFSKDAVISPEMPPSILFRVKGLNGARRMELVRDFMELAAPDPAAAD